MNRRSNQKSSEKGLRDGIKGARGIPGAKSKTLFTLCV